MKSKEELEAMTDAQVLLMVSCHGVGTYHENRALRKRLESIAKKLDDRDKSDRP